MIRVDEELIKKVSGLSKLELSPEETKKFTKDFKDILNAFDSLEKADTSGVKSSFRPYEERNTLREDVVGRSVGAEEALKFTKNREKGQFVSPRTIE